MRNVRRFKIYTNKAELPDKQVLILGSNPGLLIHCIPYAKSPPLLAMTFLYHQNDCFLFLSSVPFPLSSRST